MAIVGAQASQPQYFAGTGHWYQVVEIPSYTWVYARDAAASAGGYLACIESQEENSFVASILPNVYSACLGGYEQNGNFTWAWITGELWGYTNWNSATNEPNDGSGNPPPDIRLMNGVLSLQPVGTWDDCDSLASGGPALCYVVEYNSDPGCKFGNALRFDGVDDSVAIPIAALNGLPQGTVEAWVKFDTLSLANNTDQSILRRAGYCIGDLRLAKEVSSGPNGDRFYLSLDAGMTRLDSKTIASVSTFIHVAGTWDGSYWRIYINGTAEDSFPSTITLTTNNDMRVYVGNVPVCPPALPEAFKGQIDEIRISNVVRTPAEFCLTGECTPDANTIALLHFNEHSPDTVFDASGNNNRGIIYGATRISCDFICGDANGSGTVNISDAVYLIAYIFSGGPAPEPLLAGDANCSGSVNISDAVYLIAYIFSGGPAPCEGCK